MATNRPDRNINWYTGTGTTTNYTNATATTTFTTEDITAQLRELQFITTTTPNPAWQFETTLRGQPTTVSYPHIPNLRPFYGDPIMDNFQPTNTVEFRYQIIEEINRQLRNQNRHTVTNDEFLQIDTVLNERLSGTYSQRRANIEFSFIVERADTRSAEARFYSFNMDALHIRYDIMTGLVRVGPKYRDTPLTRSQLMHQVGHMLHKRIKAWSYKKFLTTEFIPGKEEGILKVYDKPILWIRHDRYKTLTKFVLPEGFDKKQMNLIRHRLRQLNLRVKASGRHELLVVGENEYRLKIGEVFNLSQFEDVQIDRNIKLDFKPTQIPLL